MRKGIIAALGVVLLIVGATAQGCDTTPGSAEQNDGAADAPISNTDMGAWEVISNVDRYTNIAFRCKGANGLYVPRNTDTMYMKFITVIPNDPNCVKK
jgi:hypothetical protein